MKDYRVAVVGATGMVGREFIKVLEQRRFPMVSISLWASDRSAGKKLLVNQQEIEVGETTPESFQRMVKSKCSEETISGIASASTSTASRPRSTCTTCA